MPNTTKESVLQFLGRYAFNAPVGECLDIANDIDQFKKSDYYLRSMLAVLSSRLLTDKGEIRPEFVEGRPAWQKAMKEVQQCHAWVVCGPVPDAMEKLLLEFDAKNQ